MRFAKLTTAQLWLAASVALTFLPRCWAGTSCLQKMKALQEGRSTSMVVEQRWAVQNATLPMQVASPQNTTDARPVSLHVKEAQLIGFSSYSQMLEIVGENMQWHGDVFADAKHRDPGLSFFRATPVADWVILAAAVVVLVLIDYAVLRHFTGKDKLSNSCVLGFWIFAAVVFNVIVWCRQGRDAGLMWLSGYLLEWLLSMDNLFVFILVFRVYVTPKQLLHKALFLGIIGAAIFRMAFFIALTTLLHMLHWFRFVFGVVLIYSGFQAARDEDEDLDVQELFAVKIMKRMLGGALVEKYDLENHSLFITSPEGTTQATLLVPVVVCLEMTDILFAVDSVSAKVAQIPNYYVAYSSSVIAMFGLRALFFIIEDLVETFALLKYGLCFILIFIGLELMAEDYVKLPAQVVCVVIFAVFAVCTAGPTAQNIFKRIQRTESAKSAAEEDVPIESIAGDGSTSY